jgi:hypothetical protein
VLASAVVLGATAFIGPLAVNHTLTLQLLALSGTAALLGVMATPGAVRNVLIGLLVVVACSAVYAIGQKAGYLPLRSFIAVDSVGRVEGIYREPDALGLYCAVGFVATLWLNAPTWLKIALCGVLGLASLFSQARASLIALVVVAAAAVVVNAVSRSDPHRRRQNRRVIAAFAVVILAATTILPGEAGRLENRISTGFRTSGQDVGAAARTEQIRSLELLARTAPWYGDGFSAAGRVTVDGFIEYGAYVPNAGAVSTDWVLGWWVDGKLLAIPLIGCMCLLALRRAGGVGGQMLIVVLVTSLVSDAIMTPITWFAAGLCFAELAASERRSEHAALAADAQG